MRPRCKIAACSQMVPLFFSSNAPRWLDAIPMATPAMATPAELADALFASPSTAARVDGLFSSRPQAKRLETTTSEVAAKRRQHVEASLLVHKDGSVVVALRVSSNRPPASHDASAGLADALFASSPSTDARVDGLFSSRPQAESRPLCAEMAAEVPCGAATHPTGAAAATSSRTQQADMRSDDAACSELHQLLFMVHGIGQHDDFVDGQFLSWDGTEGMAGGNMEFRQMLEALLGGKLREVPLWLAVQSVEWHAQLHRPEIDAMVAACSPEGVRAIVSIVRAIVSIVRARPARPRQGRARTPAPTLSPEPPTRDPSPRSQPETPTRCPSCAAS